MIWCLTNKKLYYSLIEKELHLLERLNITICDMTGNIDEVAERLKNSEIRICSHDESADMQMSVQFKRDIMGVVGNYNALWDRVCG